ncbi:MAG: hypothetical protein AB8B91_01710 [Rubripirellula sp.]
MRSSDPEHPRPIRDLLRRLIKAPAALAFFWPVLMIVCGYVSWHRWGAQHLTPRYQGVDVTQIQVTPPPEHVRSNVVKTVYRDTAMDGLSLLDQEATAKVASAFSMHPWVRQVIGVRKLPGGKLDVQLEYREPVAMVLVSKPNPVDQQSYFLPIDGEGVLLPCTEFARSETRNFIHIEVPGVYASNRFIGTPFGDTRVEAAARLAEILAPFREQAQIHSIGTHGDLRQSEITMLELTMKSGATMFWGFPPGQEPPGERTVEMKLQALMAADPATNTDLRIASPSAAPLR